MALQAWEDAARGDWPPGFPEARRIAYSLAEIRYWLRQFLHRFFTTSQFKRSALPNGPKVTAGGSLSPRGDWRAPSDGNARAWLAELEANVPEEAPRHREAREAGRGDPGRTAPTSPRSSS